MTGFFPITRSPTFALDNVKLDGLIPLSKGLYLASVAFNRPHGTFVVGVRLISNVLKRFGGLGQGIGIQRWGLVG